MKRIFNFCFLFLIFYFSFFSVISADDSGVSLSVTVSAPGEAVCGNSAKETGEQCDGADLNSETCVTRGFLSGTLSCGASCAFVTSACSLTAPVVSTDSNTGGGGGGGGGGGAAVPAVPAPAQTAVAFSGHAYPMSRVSILKDGQIAMTTIAGPDAKFNASLAGLSAGNYTFSVYGEDNNGKRSDFFSFSILTTQDATTNIGGIFISPTISVDKSEVKRGDDIAIFGQTARQSEVTIAINSEEEFFVKTQADKDGVYLYNFDTSPLEPGDHSAKSKAALAGSVSKFSAMIPFRVGIENILAPKITEKKAIKGDVDGDKRVNLIDFSIAAYWYKRAGAPASVDLNGDKKVDLIDFSIMAHNWTG